MALKDHGIIEAIKPLGGGWRYMQTGKDGSLHRIPSTGAARSSYDLIDQVKQFRINEGMNMGDVEADIAGYISKVSPINDIWKGKRAVLNKPQEENYIPPIQRLRQWLEALGPRKPRTVSKVDANERAVICAACPQNIRWKTKCGECNKTVDYLGVNVRRVAVYEMDDALHGCRMHGIHLPTAVFIDQDDLPAKVPQAPANCWLPEPTTDAL